MNSRESIHGQSGNDQSAFAGGLPEVSRRRPDLFPQLTFHLSSFLEKTGRTQEEQKLILEVTKRYLSSRFERGLELASPKVEQARHLAQAYFNEEFFGEETFVGWQLCMDRRTRKTLIAGIPGRFGGSLRSPGGRPEGFSRKGFGNELILDEKSLYAGEIERSVQGGRRGVQVLDSHHGCAKVRDFEEEVVGQKPEDNGVQADRRYKGEMIRAIKRSFGEAGNGNHIFLQTSFNPGNGYMDFLDEERFEQTVINTGDIANGPLADIFKQFAFNLDWLKDYENSANTFWHNINRFRGEALPIVKEELRGVYPYLDQNDPQKFGMKARVALANAYAGWLSNQSGEYPHNYHNEDLVVALMGGEHGPFEDMEAFEIPREGAGFRINASYAARLVRQFRTMGRENPANPVPLILQHRVEGLTPADTFLVSELVGEIAQDLPKRNWETMDYRDLTKYVINRFGGVGKQIPAEFTDAFSDMVGTMRGVYNPDIHDELRESIYRGSIVPIPVFVDDDRAPIAVLPLMPTKR